MVIAVISSINSVSIPYGYRFLKSVNERQKELLYPIEGVYQADSWNPAQVAFTPKYTDSNG